ncbi:MAG: hypothetical protein IJO83_05530 [Clostridia bacterium]|nr:hypothetical protein [Clostridia bacterium]
MTKKLFKTIFILAVMVMSFSTSVNAEILVFDPGQDDNWHYHGVFYGRGLQLQTDEAGENKGKLYATCEYYYYPGKWGQEHFPIFESSDGGKTWKHISDIYDTEFTKKKWMKSEDGTYYEVPEGTDGATTYYDQWWGMVFEPQLFELPEDLGNLKKGTVISGGVTKANDHCAIVVYYSTDGLCSWNYLSTVALGGKEQTGIGSAIWEPFFVYENNALYCFFSDERGMADGGGQRLVFSKTTNGLNWNNVVDVCNYQRENKNFRPGMPVVTKLPDGRYFMIYEGVNMHGGYLPTYYKITNDIEKWKPTEREDGVLPLPLDGGSPYCITLTDGTLVVGSHSTNKVAVNTDSLKTESWTLVDTNIGNAYTRCLVPLMDNKFMVVSAGAYSAPDPHKLTVSVEEINIPGEINLENADIKGTTPWGEVEPNFDNSAKNVIDSDSDTFFDGLTDGYFVIDLGKEYTVSGLGYRPRTNFGFRVSGGLFYGSKDNEMWELLYTIPKTGGNDMLNYVPVARGSYRYIKYTSDGVNACNMAEIKLYSEDFLKVNIDGIWLEYSEEPVMKDGVLMLPLRVVAEAMGADVGWMSGEKSAVVIINDKLLKLPIGSYTYYLDGSAKEAYTEISLINGTTYVSTDVVSDSLGAKVKIEGNRVYVNSED